MKRIKMFEAFLNEFLETTKYLTTILGGEEKLKQKFGAYDFLGSDREGRDYLSFKVDPKINRFDYIKIVSNKNSTYNIEFGKTKWLGAMLYISDIVENVEVKDIESTIEAKLKK